MAIQWEARQSVAAHVKPISSLKFSHDGRFVASASADRSLKVWTCAALCSADAAPSAVATLYGHEEGVSDVAWSPDAQFLVSASDDKTARIWDVELRKAIVTLGRTHTNSNNHLGGVDAHPTHFEGEDGHSNFVFCVDVNPQGSLIATGSFDETVRLWDVRSGRCVSVVAAHQEPVISVHFSHDGTLLTTGSYDGLVRVWDVASTQCLRTIVTEPSSTPVAAARFTPNSRYVLSGTLDGKLRLWNYMHSSPQCLRTYAGHINRKFCVHPAFLRDETRNNAALVASGSEDGKIYMWDLQTQETVHVVNAHEGDPVMAVATHRDHPNWIVSGANKVIKTWERREVKEEVTNGVEEDGNTDAGV